MNNYVSSIIRTWVPVLIGTVVAWLAAKTGVVIDEQSQAGLVATATAVAIGIYYAAIRWAEQKFPAIGWLLGLAKQPGYSQEGAPPAQPAPDGEAGEVTLGTIALVLECIFFVVAICWFVDNAGWLD